MLKLQTTTSAVEFDYEQLHDAGQIVVELRTLESPINEWGTMFSQAARDVSSAITWTRPRRWLNLA